MPEENSGRRSSIDRLKDALLLLCLLAPSVWMIATIPPLWRDTDAYVQLTQDPRVATFWGHAPAYCYVAKVPLFIGEQWERLRGHPSPPRIVESQPPLTDAGTWILITAQHLGLGLTAFFFIRTVSRVFWGRLALAGLWASNALCYTFAHCVGSEALGMILIILLATKAVRLVQHPGEPAWQDWYLFAVLLLLCLLSRDLNLALIVLLPATFLICAIWNSIVRAGAPWFRHAIMAIAIGLASVVIAHWIPEGLARKTKLHPHSRIGYTFLWRLRFLDNLSPDSRAALVRKASEQASSEKVRRLIQLHEQMAAEQTSPLGPTLFVKRAIDIFGGHHQWEQLDDGLKQMALAFLWPPSPELARAVKTDLVAGMNLPVTNISDYLFATTAFYFEHKLELPGYAALFTFRGDANTDRINALPAQHRYFHLWQNLSYRRAFTVWLVILPGYIFLARRKPFQSSATTALAIAFMAVGLLQFGASCVLHDFEPRFAFPMWELLLLSGFLLLGNAIDLIGNAQDAREKSAGQLLCPEP